MVQMSPSITLQGKVKFSMKKMFTGSEMAEAILAGPGEVSLAPSLFGDITTIPINGDGSLNMGKDAFLACTAGVEKKIKSQGLGKAFFSGEDMFLYRVSGQGLLWVTSFGAIVVREVCKASLQISLQVAPALLQGHSVDRQDSSSTTNSTLLTTDIWWPGVVNTQSRELARAGSTV